MASMNISVPDPMRDWVQARIESGQYASVSDYVRDLIRRDQAEDRQAIVAALIEGEKSGISPDGIPEIIAQFLQETAGKAE